MSKIAVYLCSLALVLGLSAIAYPSDIVLARAGKTTYQIVVSANADVSTIAVAKDMADILKEITGADFPVVTDAEKISGREIVLGADNTRLAALNLEGMTKGFPGDAYEIRTVDGKLIIAGAPPRGTINGIYGFLQDHLGCRWFTPGCQYMPKKATVKLGEIRDRQKPAFRYRSTNAAQHWDASWTARNRLNACKAWVGATSFMSDPRLATIESYYSAHAMGYIPGSLFQEHPEYYAEINGKRVMDPTPSQRSYCVTNPGFAAYMVDRLKKGLPKDKNIRRVVGIGQADNSKSCQCAQCKASYKRVGLAGTYMEFVNKVAEEIGKEYPNAIVDTLAYGITFAATSVKMRENVRVTWCPISACYAHPLDDCPINHDRGFMVTLEKWLANTSHLQIWYYQYMTDNWMPHMELHAAVKNFAIFRRLGVEGIFVEDNPSPTRRSNPVPDGDKLTPGFGDVGTYGYFTFPTELTHLRAYISCQLMWHTGYDVSQGIREFCQTYYGPAAKEMEQYVLAVDYAGSYERKVGLAFAGYSGIHQSAGQAPMMKISVMQNMDEIFDTAEKKTANDPTFLRRVKMARLSLQLEMLCFVPAGDPLRKKAYNGFFPLAEELGIIKFNRTGITEGAVTLAEFKAIVSEPEKINIPGMEKLGANILDNSSFEIEITGDGIPDGWSTSGKYLPEEYQLDPTGVSIDANKAYSGKSSVRLQMTPGKETITAIRQKFPVKPGDRYRASLQYQAELKKGGVHIIFTAFDKNNGWLYHGGSNLGLNQTGSEWRELSCDHKVAADTAYLMVEFILYDDKAEGVAWIDEFTCVKVDE